MYVYMHNQYAYIYTRSHYLYGHNHNACLYIITMYVLITGSYCPTVRSLLEDASITLSVFTQFCFSPLLSSLLSYIHSFFFILFTLFYIRTFPFILLILYSILHPHFSLYSTPSLFYFTYIHLNTLKICFFFYCFFRWKVFLKGII